MKVKDMINMLSKADLDSEVMLEVRDKDINLIGYFPIGSDWDEYGGYDPGELDWFMNDLGKPKSKASVELTINNDEWVELGIDTERKE